MIEENTDMTQDRRGQRVQRSCVLAICFVVLGAPLSASAHNLKVHQEFTEVAYSYLNALRACPPQLVEGIEVDVNACAVECRQEFLSTAADTEWVSDCYENLCDKVLVDGQYQSIPGAGCSGLSGPEKYSCVDNCVRSDLSTGSPVCGTHENFAPKMQRNTISSGVQTYELSGRPAWLPSSLEDRETIADEFCRGSCYLLKYFFRKSECEPLASVLAYGDIDSVKAENAVNFLRQSSDAVCPNPSEKSYRYPDDSVKAACEKDQSVGRLYGRPEAVRIYQDGKRDDGTRGLIKTSDGTLMSKSLPALLVESMKPEGLDDQQKVDVTGMVLGANVAMTDRLDDTMGRWRVLPGVEQILKTYAEVCTGLVLGAGAVPIFYLYALGCAFSYIWGAGNDCFSSWKDDWGDYWNWVGNVEKKIENYSLMSGPAQAEYDGKDLTSLYHFIRPHRDLCDDDDMCGINIADAYYSNSNKQTGLYALGTVGSFFGDFRIQYDKSRQTLENYELQNVDDGMPASSTHSRWYYENLSILMVNFRPVDNMAYYWWHKWHYARGQALGTNGRQMYGLFPLGIVLHAMQDMTLFHHAASVLKPGHSELEGYIDEGFDVQADAPLYTHPGSERFAIGPAREWDFYRRVAAYIHQMAQLKANGLLHPRALAHFVQNALGPEGVEKCGQVVGGVPLLCKEERVRQVAIPLAIAVSIITIQEATQPDNSGYFALANDLSKFEKVATTEDVSGSKALMSMASKVTQSELDPSDSWDLAYAARQPVVLAGLEAFLRGEVNTGDLLTVILKEQARGRALRSGKEFDDVTLARVATAEMDRLRAMRQFFATGSLPVLEQQTACAALSIADIDELSDADLANLEAICGGTKDTDHDGVPDLHDQCMTGASLLSGCGAVGADGCIFSGNTAIVRRPDNPNLNAIVVPNPNYNPPDGGASMDSGAP